MDEKKVAAGFAGEVGPFSGVGVRGAEVTADSLLGPAAPEPALGRRWLIMFPFGDASVFERGLAVGVPPRSGWLWSVGVGGVLTMTGVASSADGGVWGGRLRGSRFWLRERRRMRSDEAGLEGGVAVLGASVSSGAVPGTDSAVLSAAAVLVLGFLSSVELFSVLRLERNTSRSLLTDDCFDSECGGVRLV